MYDNVYSRRWDLIIAHIDTDYLQTVSGTVEYQTSYNRIIKQKTIKGWNWENAPLEFDIEFVSSGKPLSKLFQDQIKHALFNQPTYKKLYVDPSEDEDRSIVNGEIKREYINCVFSDPTVIEGVGGVWGYKCKCITSSPMALQESVTVEFNLLSLAPSTPVITNVNVDTDIRDYVYPVLIIQCAQSCSTITIKNETLDEEMKLTSSDNALNGKLLTVDCSAGMIKDNVVGSSIRYYDYLYKKEFLRLFKGDNSIKVTGDITALSLTFQNSRWFR